MLTLIISAGPLTGWRIDVDRPLSVGRSHADVRVEDPKISRRHVGLRPLGGGMLEVSDLGSSNGTLVNGQRIAGPTAVRSGDRVQIGDTPMWLAPEALPQPVAAAPPPVAAAPPPLVDASPAVVAFAAAPGDAFALSGAAARGAFRPNWGLRTRMVVTMLLLGLLYGVVLVGVVFGGAYYWIFAVIAAAVALFQVFAADKIALSALGARVVAPSEAPELHGLVDRLCLQAGLPKPKVAIANTNAANAMAVGRSPKSATVVVTTGLLMLLSPAELEGVVAHELAHIRNRDVMVMTIAGFVMVMAWWCALLARFSIRLFGAIALFGIVVWAIARLIVLTLSRHREFVADHDAALVTGRPSALASALLKVSGQGAQIPKKDLRALSGMNAFLIVPAGARSRFRTFFSTHPPVEARVAALHALERDLQASGTG